VEICLDRIQVIKKRMESKEKYLVLGLMSGTSLDGLDLALCEFSNHNGCWNFNLINCKTIMYCKSWLEKLIKAPELSSEELNILHKDYGSYLGEMAKEFLSVYGKTPDFIASHGHTIFHDPQKGITFQLGEGSTIAESSGCKTISDFRSLDVSLGGQGAPLVPIGDKMLFSDYDYCINLGGFANISYDFNDKRIAFDICPANIALNYCCSPLNIPFDKNGEIAQKGKVNDGLLKELNGLNYYQLKPPKSLGREWFENEFLTVLNRYKLSTESKLATVTMHIAQQISAVLSRNNDRKIIITGGGAHNDCLISYIKNNTSMGITIPDKDIIDFKEAIIFGFLAVLRIRNEANCLRSVTGATQDSSSGTVFNPEKNF